MSYERVNWQNLPSTATPVNATNLNKMDLGIKENSNIIGGDAYDLTATYNVGDYCIYDNTLYQCNTKITTAEAWNSSHWTQVNVINKLKKNYSTTEQVIGTWIDGKPIYQITYTGTKVSGTDVWSVLDVTNVKKIITFYGNLEAVSSGTKINYPLTTYENNNTHHAVSINITSQNKMQIHVSGSTSVYDNGDFNVTIEYLKTTD